MNIFVFGPSLSDSARYFFEKDPRRANKQILELTQCLATVLAEDSIFIPKKDGTPYRPTHKNHPVVRWLRESKANQAWASDYLWHLLFQYFRRVGRGHGCESAWGYITDYLRPADFSACTPIHHGTGVPRTGNVYEDYRDYLELKLQADAKKKEKV